MAAKQSGETKAPLVIALAFFVLTTIALGIMVYMAYDEKAQMTAKVTEAEKKATEAGKLRAIDQERVYVYQTLLGINNAEQFEGLKNARNPAEVKKEYEFITAEMNSRLAGVVTAAQQQLIADKTAAGVTEPVSVRVALADVFKWNWTGDKPDAEPETSVLKGFVRAVAKEQLASAKQNQDAANLAAAIQAYDEQKKQTQAAQTNFNTKAQEFPVLVKKMQDDANAAVQQVRATYSTDTLNFNKKVKELVEAAQNGEIKLNELKDRIASLDEVRKQLDAKLELKEDPFEFDKPHGKVTRRDGNQVSINIGSAANVRPGLTFSVQPSNTPDVGLQTRMRQRTGRDGRPLFENQRPVMEIIPKGTIEVTEVLGPNVSLARITGQSDQLRDAILVGDVLYNSAWRPGSSDHVALLGLFDVDGDGVDDTRQVVRDLQKMGIVVDAYFDMEQKKWEGRVTERTIYTVEGYYPDQIGGDATLTAAKSALYTAMQTARQEAKDKGARIVKMRDFFPRIGYRVKLDVSTDRINQAYLKYLTSLPPMGDGAAAPAPAPEPGK